MGNLVASLKGDPAIKSGKRDSQRRQDKEEKKRLKTKLKEEKRLEKERLKQEATAGTAAGGQSAVRNGSVSDEAKILVVAIYDFTSEEPDDLTFCARDTMEILDKGDENWWKAKLLRTGDIGFVPSNYVSETDSLETYAWYFGNVQRKETETYLLDPRNDPGTFLVRPSERDPGNYTLSVKDIGKDGRESFVVKHYRIRTMDNNAGFYVSASTKFSKLSDLIKHYTGHAGGLCLALGKPCPRPSPGLKDLTHETGNKWEISRKDLTMLTKLGSGQFGDVFKARHSSGREVAVKTLKPGTMSKQAFLQEAEVMKKCDHPNLVTLYAVCSEEEPIYIITELMENGSLLNYLRGPKSRTLTLQDLINFASQCAAGMAYLEANKYVHRDLAARNVLVSKGLSCKVADFGLARAVEEEIYVAHTGAKFPIKWTAIEAANYGEFTTKSDVWSYGILLVEIFTKGQMPYPGMANQDVLRKLDNGYRMPRYDDVPEPVYDYMLKCWDKTPAKRPTFEHLCDVFSTYDVSTAPSYVDQPSN